MTLKELLAKRANLVNQARGILDGADGEERGLTDDESARYDALMNDVADKSEDIQRREQMAAVERELDLPVSDPQRPDGDGQTRDLKFVSRGMRQAQEVEPGCFDMPEWDRVMRTGDAPYRRAYQGWLRTGNIRELRALQVDIDTAGGYMTPPVQFVDRLIQAVDNAIYMRQWATIFSVPNADSLGAVSLDSDPADPTWTSELKIGSEDSDMDFGRRELNPHPLAQYIKLSRTLLRKAPSSESLVVQRLGYKFGVVGENAYLNGTGAGQPLGVFVASDDGIGTARDVSTGNTTTSIKFDGLIGAKYTLKQQYWPQSRWMFHRDGVKQIAKLKDGNGQYIWRESVRVGEPDRILNFPVFMSEYAPSTFTTGLYVGILGDFSFYWIADALNMEMQRLVELYAATNQIAIVGRLESDGMPVLAEAFVRVTLA